MGPNSKKEISRSLTPKILNSSQKVQSINPMTIDHDQRSTQVLDSGQAVKLSNGNNIEMISSNHSMKQK